MIRANPYQLGAIRAIRVLQIGAIRAIRVLQIAASFQIGVIPRNPRL